MRRDENVSSWLIYWKDYWQDRDDYGSNAYGVIYHTRQQSFYRKCRVGDHIWLVVRNGEGDGEWKLAMHFIVSGKKLVNAPRPYRIVPDLAASEAFTIDGQPDLSPILLGLRFSSGKRIATKGALIGRSLQTIRRLASTDAQALSVCTATLTKARLRKRIIHE